MKNKSDPNRIAVIGIVWLLIVIFGYYITHNPLNSIPISPIVTNVWSVIAVLFFLTIAGGIGKRLIPLENLPDLTAAVLQAGIGLGVISVLTLIIGSFWKINPLIISLLHLFLALFFLQFEYQWIKKILKSYQIYVGISIKISIDCDDLNRNDISNSIYSVSCATAALRCAELSPDFAKSLSSK